MPSSDFESRRQFLKGLALLLGCQHLGTRVFAAESNAEGKPPAYKLADWTGDDFSLGHRLRIGDLPELPDKAEQKVDFVIVGGGVSGLASAFYLKSEDFLLLEQYGDLGGHSRGGSYRGIDYSYGAAYIGETDGIFGELYSAIDVHPVKLNPDRNEYFYDGQWAISAEGDKTKPVYKEFARLIEQAKPIWEQIPEDADPAKLAANDLKKLDSTTFLSCLSGYSKEFMSVLDSFCKSSFGGGTEQLSALAGFALINDLVETTYVFKGGNPAIARGLVKKLNDTGKGRCKTGAFVWKIEVKEDGASVVYSLPDGSAHRVDCRHVIVATPPLVAARQLTHIPDLLKAQLFNFRFCSYLVANMLMKEKLFKGKYDCFVGEPFSFADITVAECPYILTDSYKPEMGSVLTIYQPYPAGSEGRPLMLVGDREKFASSLTEQMEKLVPGFMKSIDEVVLTRWGHALALCGPNFFSNLMRMRSSLSGGAMSLCHSSTYGWPAVESAICAAKEASDRARKAAAKPGIVAN